MKPTTNYKRLIELTSLFVLTSLVFSCGGGSDEAEIKITEIVIFIPDTYKSPLIDDTFQLDASAIYTVNGENEQITSRARWQSSDPDIATVSATGEINTLTPGEVTITASFSGLSQNVKLKISPPPKLDRVEFVTTDNNPITEGKPIVLAILATYVDFDTSDDIPEVTTDDRSLFVWSSSDEEIATVNEDGQLIGVSYGEVVVNVVAKENPDINAAFNLTIEAKIVSISIQGTTTYLELGENAKLLVFAELSDETSNPIPHLVNWTYDTENIVRITSTGLIKSTNLGTVNVIASFGEFQVEHEIIVENPIEIFVLKDTGGFNKLAWYAQQNVSSYTLTWNNGASSSDSDEENTEINLSIEELEWIDSAGKPIEKNTNAELNPPLRFAYTHSDIDSNKPYYYTLTFTRNDEPSIPSKEQKIWPHVGQWSFRNTIAPRIYSAGASYQEKMYLFGGELTVPVNSDEPDGKTKQILTNEVWEYHILKNKWTKVASLPKALKFATACASNELIYLIGGEDSEGFSDAVHVYNTALNDWEVLNSPLPRPLSRTSCNILNKTVYVSGGYDGETAVSTTYGYDTTTETWNLELPSLNTARYNHASVIFDNKLYIAGGTLAVTDGEKEVTSQMEIFDPLSDISLWKQLKAMETPRSEFSLYAWNDKLYALGGINNDNNTRIDDVSAYSPDTDSWQLSSTMPFPNNAYNSTQFNDAIYFWGGSQEALNDTNTDGQSQFMRYDINTGTWIHDKSNNSARVEFSALMIDEILYVIGGANRRPTTDFRAYNTKKNSWQKLNAMNTARQRASAVAYTQGTTKRIYVLGGLNSSVALDAVEMFDFEENSWDLKTSMDKGRSYAAAATFGIFIFVFGGDGIGTSDTFEVYNMNQNIWQPMGKMPETHVQSVAIALNNKIYLIGGIVDSVVSNKVSVYTPSTNTWTINAGTLNIPRARPGIAVLNGLIYIFAGTGLDKDERSLRSAEFYTPFTKKWTELPTLPLVSNTAQGASFENKIYLINEKGSTTTKLTNDIFILE